MARSTEPTKDEKALVALSSPYVFRALYTLGELLNVVVHHEVVTDLRTHREQRNQRNRGKDNCGRVIRHK